MNVNHQTLLSLEEVCETLSITTATGQNWIKRNLLIPTTTLEKTLYFSQTDIQTLKTSLLTPQSTTLKSRRNKALISGNSIYRSYLLPHSPNEAIVENLIQTLKNANYEPDNETIRIFLADCSFKLFQCSIHSTQDIISTLTEIYDTDFPYPHFARLLKDLLPSEQTVKAFVMEHPNFFCNTYHFQKKEDTIGFLYSSLNNMKQRKATGSYYTPTKVIQELYHAMENSEAFVHDRYDSYKILDPCCGSGNFLLQLPDHISYHCLYGYDIDTISVQLTRINLYLNHPSMDIAFLYQNIKHKNFLSDDTDERFDYIIGNPPWGYRFSTDEKHRLKAHYQCITGNTIESYDLFIEQALSCLSINGTLCFLLPESVLTTKNHRKVRAYIQSLCQIISITYLEQIFDNVQCPAIFLQLQRSTMPFSTENIRIKTENNTFTIQLNRILFDTIFNFNITDEEYLLLQKILNCPQHTTLQHQADFALGIVTGNNASFLTSEKEDSNEAIILGKDLSKYKIAESNTYLHFHPELFQQTAPEHYYRAPEKIVYRFINKSLIFAYDDKQRLTLNSCNILIPNINGLHIKYILAILNSSVAQYVFRKQFHSIKVLRAHIEQIPIPIVPQTKQAEIITLVDTLLTETNLSYFTALYKELDQKIAALYEITEAEYLLLSH